MAKPVSKSSVPQGSPLRLLIVEHTQADVELAVKELERAGFQVSAEMVSTPEQFSERLARQEYDIVLADYRLPDWTGMDALAILQQQAKSIPFILVTGTLGEERAVECMKQGATDYVLKDHLVTLPVAVRRALGEHKLREDGAHAEEALRESENKFRSLAETAACSIYLSDETRFLYVNPASEAISGYTRQELLRMSPFDVIHPDARERVRERTLARLRGESFPANVESPIVTKSGEVRWLDFRVATIPYEGRPVILATAFDVTERKHAEEALRESERRYRELIERSPTLICTHTLDGILQSVNTSALSALGYRPEQLVGRHLRELVPAEVRNEVETYLGRIRRQSVDEGVVRVVGREGKSHYLLYRNAVLEEAGGLPFVLGNAVDITDKVEAKRLLHRSEAALRSLVENAPYAIYRTDVERGRFASVNPALVKMLGYATAEEVLALDMAQDVYRSPEERSKVIQILQAQGEYRDLELHWKRKDGKDLLLRASGRFVRDEDGREYIETIAEDVTERRLLEQQFRQAQKMEAIGQLAGGVAHDFNNLLMVMSSFTELVGNAGPVSEKQRHYLDEVLKATRRAAGLTQQLLAFSRKQLLAPAVLDLNSVVTEMGKMLPSLIGEHISVKLLADASNARVDADRGQIEQVLMNLAVNARDAMPKGGALIIEVKDVTLDQPHLGPNYQIPPGSYVMLAVSDTGEGMDAQTQSHIFEPFFTTKERGKGTGLGLATVYGIVKQSGGYISVYSEKDVGSTFKMYFPAVEKARPSEAATPLEQPASGGTETILLVEDEQALRLATREFLLTKGYQVLEAANGAEALEKVAQQAGPVHLLITDVVMPGMNGRELAERLRLHPPGPRVLYISGYTDGAIASVAGLEKEASFLQKPFALEALARTVRQLLDGVPAKAGPA